MFPYKIACVLVTEADVTPITIRNKCPPAMSHSYKNINAYAPKLI